MESSNLKKKNRGENSKEIIDLDENFQTMEDWNANIVAFNTPYKEGNLSKTIRTSYRRQLNFDPLLTTNAVKNPTPNLTKRNPDSRNSAVKTRKLSNSRQFDE